MAYVLNLTAEDIRTISFVGYRYGWSDALSSLDEGENTLAEHEAWEIRDACEGDTEGGHSLFPMLSESCELYSKLITFLDRIV